MPSATPSITITEGPVSPELRAARDDVISHFLGALGQHLIGVNAVTGIRRRIDQNHQAQFDYDDALVNAVLARCTEVDSGARNVDTILNGTLAPEGAVVMSAGFDSDAGVDSIDVLSGTNVFAPEVHLWISRFAGNQAFRTAASVILLRRN